MVVEVILALVVVYCHYYYYYCYYIYQQYHCYHCHSILTSTLIMIAITTLPSFGIFIIVRHHYQRLSLLAEFGDVPGPDTAGKQNAEERLAKELNNIACIYMIIKSLTKQHIKHFLIIGLALIPQNKKNWLPVIKKSCIPNDPRQNAIPCPPRLGRHSRGGQLKAWACNTG